MLSRVLICGILFATLSACTTPASADSSGTSTEPSAAQKSAKTKTDADDVELRKNIAELKASLDRLQTRMQNNATDSSTQTQEWMKAKAAEAQKALKNATDELNQSGEEAQSVAKTNVSKALKNISSAIDNLATKAGSGTSDKADSSK